MFHIDPVQTPEYEVYLHRERCVSVSLRENSDFSKIGFLKSNFEYVDILTTTFFLCYSDKRWGHPNKIEDIRVVKKVTLWNPNGLRTKERPKIRWADEVISHLKKINLRNWSQIFKDRKACNGLVQRTKARVKFVVSEEEDYTVTDKFVVRE
jgi:hypothetical protein